MSRYLTDGEACDIVEAMREKGERYMKKSLIRMVLLLWAGVMLLSLTSCNSKDTLHIEVEAIESVGDGQLVTLEIENNTGGNISFGWVNSCEIYVVTDEGKYYLDPPGEDIKKGESEFVMELFGCPGEVEQISITNLCLLSDRGLPDRHMKDITIYDAAEGIDEFEGSFSLFTSSHSLFLIFFVFVIVLMVALVITMVIVAVRKHRRDQLAMAQFNPYGSATTPNNDDSGFAPPPTR